MQLGDQSWREYALKLITIINNTIKLANINGVKDIKKAA